MHKYILGLDLGIASVGWAAVWIDENEQPIGLLDLSVRTFNKAETDTGESLSGARRSARALRRVNRRRAHRLLRLRRLLKREGVLKAEDFDTQGYVKNLPINVWQLRVDGLDRKLEPREWAAVLLHLIKHRGYLSQRKSDAVSADKELGKLLSGVSKNHEALIQSEYRTAAELALKNFAPVTGHMRNKVGDYSHTFNRLDLEKELCLLFERQRQFDNPFTSDKFEELVRDLLMTQRVALQGDAILAMLGHCIFEPQEYRAAKNTWSAERFVWLTKLANLRIQDGVTERGLTEEERQCLLPEPYKKVKLTYKQVRKLLSLPETAVFKGLSYKKDKDRSKVEDTSLMEMKAYHEICKALEKANLKTEWQSLATQPDKLDAIGTAFSLYKTDEDIRNALADQALLPDVLEALLAGINFDKFIHLSLKALHQLLPKMEEGIRYDEACAEIYGDHHGQRDSQQVHRLLPPIPTDEIRNPVVLRSLAQARKVINAVVRRYGSPARVHIETGREVGKSYAERKKIKARNDENQADRKRAIDNFKELFPLFVGNPKPTDILKLRLYYQQHGQCLYTGESIDLCRLSEKGYVEIDHALPFSRTWDDSFNNKVLVLGSENQNKENRTPYEYLGGEQGSNKWYAFLARVNASAFSPAKKQRVSLRQLDEEGFKARNLNDVRYVSRFLCQFIEENMCLEGKGKRRVFASNGQLTAFLRRSWGLNKIRTANDRHHALDAVVVACTTVSIQKKVTDYVRYREMNVLNSRIVDRQTGEISYLRFPEPWEFFRREVMIRVFNDDPVMRLKNELPDRPSAVHEFVKPLFVSRAPTRKVTGQGHMETVKSPKKWEEDIGICKIPLKKLKRKDIENIVGYPDREPEFYKALSERLEQFKDDPAKAFVEPFYKPSKQGRGVLVRSVRVKGDKKQKSGFLIHHGQGLVENATMVRIDVFGKKGKNYVIPIYAWQIEKGILPDRAATANKSEREWVRIDESFTFRFSLYPNDLVEVVTKDKKTIFGYYTSFDRASAGISIEEHDSGKSKDIKGLHRGIGLKGVISFDKYQVDVLGKTISLCRLEKRQGFKVEKTATKA